MTSALEQSGGHFYKAIMQSAVDPIIVISEGGYIHDINEATVKNLSTKETSLLAKKLIF